MYKRYRLLLDIAQEIDDKPFSKEEIPDEYHRGLANSFLTEFLKDESAVKRLFVTNLYDYLSERVTLEEQAYQFFKGHIDNIDDATNEFGNHREVQVIAEVADRCTPEVRSFIYKTCSIIDRKGEPLLEMKLTPETAEEYFDVFVKRLWNFNIYVAGLQRGKEKEEAI